MSIAIRSRVVCCFVVAMLATSCTTDGTFSSADDRSTVPRRSVVLDYSPTLSDAGALLYLASNRAVDLVAVTLPGTGETDCEPGVRQTRALLVAAGNPDVPVACGRNEPLTGERDWPLEWQNSLADSGALPDVDPEPVGDAEQLLLEVIQAAETPLTVVTVGPMTNLGAVLQNHPELVSHIERVVVMGGAFDVSGNVEQSAAAEWNIYIDPESTRLVLASGVPVLFVPLDATNKVPWTERFSARLRSLDSLAARTMSELAHEHGSLDGFFMWDELAAMAAVRPELVSVEQRSVVVGDDGSTTTDAEGVAVDVAVDADDVASLDEFVRVLNLGELPAVESLTATELDYIVAMGGIDSQLSKALGKVYAGVGSFDEVDNAVAQEFLTGFLAALKVYSESVRALTPPGALLGAQTEMVDAIAEYVGLEAEMLAALEDDQSDDPFGVFEEFLNRDSIRDRVAASCQEIVDYSFLRGGPRPCSLQG